ncbi:TPA: hypothetical protein ACUT9R_005805, partial [Pseudomonas aeruginosa]
MLIDHFANEPMPQNLGDAIISLARESVIPLSPVPIERSSPLYPILEAEVTAKLVDAFRNMAMPPQIDLAGGRVETGITEVVVAINETEQGAELAGFTLYKPRLPVSDSASITYAVVAEKYRRQGVLRQMFAKIMQDYPAIGLDCEVELVPVWIRLGFKVASQQGCHIAMESAPLAGKNWMMTDTMLSRIPIVMEARQMVQQLYSEQRLK